MHDYDYYLLACDDIEASPLSRWKFQVAYSLYTRHFYDAVDFDLETGEIAIRKDYFPLIPWTRLRKIAKTVDRGRELAQSRPDRSSFDDEGQSGGPGVREPLRPIAPTLSGSGARRLPSDDTASKSDYERWAALC